MVAFQQMAQRQHAQDRLLKKLAHYLPTKVVVLHEKKTSPVKMIMAQSMHKTILARMGPYPNAQEIFGYCGTNMNTAWREENQPKTSTTLKEVEFQVHTAKETTFGN
jgi:hypothetical protein